MASIRGKANSLSALLDWSTELAHFWDEHKYITVTASTTRSLDINATIRLCYKQIEDHRDDMTTKDVERHCKLMYGVPILRNESVVFNHVFGEISKLYSHERLLKIMDTFKITSDDEFTTAMGNKMIECMIQDYPFIVIEKKGKR